MAVVRLSSELIRSAMQSSGVRAALRVKADRVRSRAEGLAAGDGVSLESKVTEGTRRQGRPYARVESPNVSQEWGDRKTERRRILGRAADSA